MTNFKNYKPEKYQMPEYKEVEKDIYLAKDLYGYHKEVYVTSLSFEQEPEQYGEEGGCPQNITQIPFEDILDKFSVWVTDFYDGLNKESEVTCYQEFGSYKLENIKNLRSIIGKRVYIAQCTENDDYDIEDEDGNGEEIYFCLKIE